jgi:2-methylisocitrate lyase-like PEP mutase family enzyme
MAEDPMSNPAQIHRAETFRALHDRSPVLVLPNAWDAGSARLFEAAGFPAVATTSGGVAWSLGHADGERAPFGELLEAARRILRSVTVPVSVDMESGYGATPDAVAASVGAMIEAGAVGINLEDSIAGGAGLRDIEEAAARIAAARAAAQEAGVPIVINARVDVWMAGFDDDPAARFDQGLRRARRYLAAGADCVYPIGLADADGIAAFVAALDAPVNVGARPGMPDLAELARLGVARVSTATRLVAAAYAAADHAARELVASGTFDGLAAALGHADIDRLFAGESA